MNPFISILAKELAAKLNGLIDLPFMNEEEERLFFEYIVIKVLEITTQLLGKQLLSKRESNEADGDTGSMADHRLGNDVY